jgi:hypothetical protein
MILIASWSWHVLARNEPFEPAPVRRRRSSGKLQPAAGRLTAHLRIEKPDSSDRTFLRPQAPKEN